MIFSGKKGKNGVLTIEIALATLLCIVVLFAVLGIFSSNLKAMISNSNFNNIFHRKDVTANSFYNKTYSKPKIDVIDAQDVRQQNVEVVADQGLTAAQYNEQAIKTINDLAKLNTLTDDQKRNLALELTILANSGASNASTMLSGQIDTSGTKYQQGTTFKGLGETNGIHVKVDPTSSSYKTTVDLANGTSLFYIWSENATAGSPGVPEPARGNNIRSIIAKFSN